MGIQPLGRIGVVANPHAGAGPSVLKDVLTRLYERFRGADVVLNDDTFEAAVARACGLDCTKVHGPAGDARRLTEELLAAGVDTVVGVGGDGTLGDIAGALVPDPSLARLFGIGIGSSNVGPLVGTSLSGLDGFLSSPWREVAVHALDVRLDGERIAVAFHDVAPANTYFGTRSGRRVDLDAGAALRGVDRQAEPAPVCNAETWIRKNARRVLADTELTGCQVVASPLNDVNECRGKAVSGLLSWGPYLGCRGVVAVASTLLIRTRLSCEDLLAAEPLRLFQLGLVPGDVVEVGGLQETAVVVVDGTPRVAPGPDRVLSVGAIEGAVVVLRRTTEFPRAGEREESCSTAAS
jgi:hypothetical protein